MIDSSALLADLKTQLKALQIDLRASAEDRSNQWGARLRAEYEEALRRERTGHSWMDWRDNEVDQAAVAWVVATAFLRFCEDNDLLAGARLDGMPIAVGWIAGPGDRTQRAEENLTAYFRTNPIHNRRHWLQQGFRVLAAQPAGAGLVDPRHNPVWLAEISPESANALIAFWRRTDAGGVLVHDFTDPNLDTRFLGDLYQDLSEHAKKTYALLQTPVFVEEFILEQTLTSAIAEFGLNGLKVIDPTCGSGHFLLGAFERLNRAWLEEAPALDAKERIRRAMASIHGVDLNPFAVAIARFRLTLAGLKTMGERSLVGVPAMGFRLAIGDSLLGEQGGVPETFGVLAEDEQGRTYLYDSEDLSDYFEILRPGKYHVVVGNPPYIAVTDRALRKIYRQAYRTAHGQYNLSIPFMELFFRLAIRGEQGRGAGYVGQITANGFMKREFGRKVVEDLFAGFHLENPVDLTRVIDTSRAHIPGHGTPTVILIGRRRRPVDNHVRVVAGVRGEPGVPVDPAKGRVWREIVEHVNDDWFEGRYVSISLRDRKNLTVHPWSLGGETATALKEAIEAAPGRMGARVWRMGMFGDSHAEDYFAAPVGTFVRLGVDAGDIAGAIDGNAVRDWAAGKIGELFFAGGPAAAASAAETSRTSLWPWRRSLWNRATFSGTTYRESGIDWLSWHQVSAQRDARPRIAFAKIATHFHAAIVRRDDIEKPGALRIELPPESLESEFFELAAALNSSVACFWLKQVCHNKGNGGIGGGIGDEDWEPRYEFTGTKLDQFPIADQLPIDRGRMLDTLAGDVQGASPLQVIMVWMDQGGAEGLAERLREARADWERLRARMIFEQEELDWDSYRIYGLIEEDLTYRGSGLDELALGERAFEIALARRVASGEEETAWFDRHHSVAISDAPHWWPSDYSAIVQRRLHCIAHDGYIELIERPECKRRWWIESWDAQRQNALRGAILTRLENPALWQDAQGPAAHSVAELADALRNDRVVRELARVLSENAEPDLAAVIASLIWEEAVPFLAAHRYKPSGVDKFRAWQEVWALQRREDMGDSITIPLPPKYAKSDFRSPTYWRARGKFDMPKERFILYPGVRRAGDSTPVIGWAGWSHRDQALALAREIPVQQALGVDDAGIEPLVAGLVELECWLHQWHSEIETAYGTSSASVISGVVDQYLARVEKTRDQVSAWVPPVATRARALRL
ncbi:BREX-2 system adenine-specific DNA-methyltransferase PglX [Kribbella sindirgiensis]|uniref:BREX-2 system adenine-specific DNA-methyltransferase PglX n=1 Tax=Kribbella sindirgiensis TaxID=1124744 RepID=UPI0013F4552E|nr:BREX-2 system adenine-specific DNA-methyltransferase PglX [Kribbella sindirgiensis]